MLSTQALLVLLAFPLVALTLFVFMPLRKAVLAAYLLGWMLLPQGQLEVPGVLPDYDRGVAIAVGVVGALVLFDARRLLRFRPALVDAPMALFLVAPLLSSLANGLGAYDGLSQMVSRCLQYAAPYLLGRVYFSDREGLRQLAAALVVGGLLYAPFCWFEMRMSPQLHNMVYGSHQHSFVQTQRLGGWRPMVFMQHGLALAMWMVAASLAGAWLLRARAGLRSPAWLLLVPVVALTAVLCRSINAWLMLAAGLAILAGSRALRTSLPLALLLAVAPVYVAVRASGAWDGSSAVALAEQVVPPDRAQSFAFRVRNENMLIDKATQRPALGWGGWGRSQVQSRRGEKLSVTDGQWIIVFGQNGLFGLLAFLAATSLPVLLFARAVPARLWGHPGVAPAAVLAVLCGLYTVDNLLNAMFNPMAVLALGGLGGLLRRRRSGLVELVNSRPAGEASPRRHALAPAGLAPGGGLTVAPPWPLAPGRGAREEEAAA